MVDAGIGKMLQALLDRGVDGNTWIFFCSDHGEMLGDHYLMYKLVFYDSSTRVPLLIRPPRQAVATGWVSAALTDHLDLTTTLLDLAGLSPMFADRGTSLLPKIAAGPDDALAQQGKEQVVSELRGPDSGANQLMLRTQTLKMNVQLKSPTEPVELYDLVQDPTECTNLIQAPAYQRIRADMLDRVNAFCSDTHLVHPLYLCLVLKQ
jgi:arylsulfatase A-like enzyme